MSNPDAPRPGNQVVDWIRQTYSTDVIEIDEFRAKEVVLKLPHDTEKLFKDIKRQFSLASSTLPPPLATVPFSAAPDIRTWPPTSVFKPGDTYFCAYVNTSLKYGKVAPLDSGMPNMIIYSDLYI